MMDGFPLKTKSTTWSLLRTVTKRRCAVTKKTIWPFQKAWRRRIDTVYGNIVLPGSIDEWVTEEEYLIMKLKGEA